VRLEGSLDAFSLPDIFQLLSFTKKTGGLHLRRGALGGVVYVTGGALTGGASDVRRQGLGRRLVGTGRVDDEAIEAAVAEATNNPGLGVGRALRDAGVVEESTLAELATEHVHDTVFDLLRWSEGDFVFVVDEPDPDDVGVTVEVEAAVAEAQRRLELWATASTTIPGPDAVLAIALSPSDDPALSREEWAMLAYLDGVRPVRDIVDATGRGEFAVVCTLAALVERGLLIVTGPDRPASVPALLRRLVVLGGAEQGEVAPPPAAPVVEPASELIPQQEAAPVTDEVVEPEPSPFADVADYDEPVYAADDVADLTPSAAYTAPDSAVVDELPVMRSESAPAMLADPADQPTSNGFVTEVVGTSAVAAHVETAPSPLIERDPSVNKSLLLRLIAGVRGL
jgi:uncharacterized protein DUF4388